MPTSRKRKFRKNTARQAIHKSGRDREAAILIGQEYDGTITVRDEKTGKVLLSGLGAEQTARLLSDDIADCAEKFFSTGCP